MNLTEKWPVLRLPALGRPASADDERLLRLFWNRAELKKALQGLDDELHSLRDRIKQQEGAHERLEEQLEQLEALLGTPDRGPDALVHFGMRKLWLECRRQLENFAAELRRQRQDHERKRQLAEFQQDRQERLKLADEMLAEARSVLELEEGRLAEGERRLSSLTALWHYFRRRDLAYELDAQRGRVGDARRHLDHMLEARRTIEKEAWPEFPGLSIQGRRGVNLAVIAYAQLLCLRLARHGLAAQARLATHRRVEDSRFGSRGEHGAPRPGCRGDGGRALAGRCRDGDPRDDRAPAAGCRLARRRGRGAGTVVAAGGRSRGNQRPDRRLLGRLQGAAALRAPQAASARTAPPREACATRWRQPLRSSIQM